MVEWLVIGTSAATAIIATGLMSPMMNAHLNRRNADLRDDASRKQKCVDVLEQLRHDLVEIHRHFNENDTVLCQAREWMEQSGDILSGMNIAKLRVPAMSLALSIDQITSLPENIRQRVMFFRRLLPNIDYEIAEAEASSRARDYGQTLQLIGLLQRKNSFVLKTTVHLYLVVIGAAPASSDSLSDTQFAEGTAQITRSYPRRIDKNTRKDLFYYNADQASAASAPKRRPPPDADDDVRV